MSTFETATVQLEVCNSTKNIDQRNELSHISGSKTMGAAVPLPFSCGGTQELPHTAGIRIGGVAYLNCPPDLTLLVSSGQKPFF